MAGPYCEVKIRRQKGCPFELRTIHSVYTISQGMDHTEILESIPGGKIVLLPRTAASLLNECSSYDFDLCEIDVIIWGQGDHL